MIPWIFVAGMIIFLLVYIYLFMQAINCMGGSAPSRVDSPPWEHSSRRRFGIGINTGGTTVEHLRRDPQTGTVQIMDAGGNYREVKPTAQSQLTTNEEPLAQDRGIICNKCGQLVRMSNDQKSSIRCSCGNQLGSE